MRTFFQRSVAAFAAGTIVSIGPAANAAILAPSRVASAVDLTLPAAANTSVSFQTQRNARCVLSAPGTAATMTVYADDRGVVSLQFTPERAGAANGAVTAQCSAAGVANTQLVRLHVVPGALRQNAVRPALGAQPLVPRGLDPAALSSADINRLQLPPRPDAARDPEAYAQWKRAVTTPVTRVGGTTVLRTDVIHGPVQRARAASAATAGVTNGTGYSTNWSGVVATGRTNQFTYWVAGEWFVPAVTTNAAESPAYSSVWDGIDGWGSGDVIQNGTEQNALYLPFFGSLAFYSAWYEFYPDNGSTTLPNFTVAAGDEIYAVSWLCYNGSGQRFGCYYMEDLTRGEASPTYSELGAKPSLFQGNSGEWVTERPTVGGTLHPLPHFNNFSFWWQHVYDSVAGGGRNACNESFSTITMYNAFDFLATTTPTACDASTFSWLNYQ